jgi:hypothetical protein
MTWRVRSSQSVLFFRNGNLKKSIATRLVTKLLRIHYIILKIKKDLLPVHVVNPFWYSLIVLQHLLRKPPSYQFAESYLNQKLKKQNIKLFQNYKM